MVLKSKKLFDQAKKIIPSGVNSPVRFFKPYLKPKYPMLLMQVKQILVDWVDRAAEYLEKYCENYTLLI